MTILVGSDGWAGFCTHPLTFFDLCATDCYIAVSLCGSAGFCTLNSDYIVLCSCWRCDTCSTVRVRVGETRIDAGIASRQSPHTYSGWV
jgi:hypothetical protein